MNNKHVKFIMYSGGFFLLILSVLAITATAFVAKGNQSYDENTISISGTGEVDSPADIATFSFTVKENAETADTAQKVISEKISKILEGLAAAGVDEKDIKTQSYTIYPKYEWLKEKTSNLMVVDESLYYRGDERTRVQTGFDVSQDISFTVRDLEKIADILNLIAATEVENLNGPSFQIDDRDLLEEEARELAIADAKQKAQRLAKELDVRLGSVVSFNENNGGFFAKNSAQNSRAVMMEAGLNGDSSFAPELPAGENTISTTVNITYRIK